MAFWQRLVGTLVAVVSVSVLASYVSETWLGFQLPGYVSGVIGGIAALPVWELLRRVGPPRGTEA